MEKRTAQKRKGRSDHRTYSHYTARNGWRRTGDRFLSGNLSKTLLRQTVLCLLIVLLAILIKKLDQAMESQTLATVQTFMSQDYSSLIPERNEKSEEGESSKKENMRQSAKKVLQTLASLPAAIETSVAQGQEKTRYIAPCNEEALNMTFDSDTTDASNKLRYCPDQSELQVYACSGGTVLSVEDEGGCKVIRIEHGGKIQSQYEGCCSVYVEPLQKVRKGELIASVTQGEESCLTFSMWKGETPVDPSDYIQF